MNAIATLPEPKPVAPDQWHAPITQDMLARIDAYWRAARSTCATRANHANIHVRGYKQRGTTPPPFDMVVLNDPDRYRHYTAQHEPD